MITRGGRHPHEIAVFFSFCLLGLLGMVFFTSFAGQQLRALPAPFAYSLFVGAFVTSLIGLVGIFVRRTIGSLIERVGLLGLTAFGMAYVIAIVDTFGYRGLSSTLFVFVVSVCNVYRIQQIGREIRELELIKHEIERRDLE